MRKIIKILFVGMVVFITSSSLYATSGKKVFETYCWGCHHQTAMAFGPSFEDIASKRSSEEVQAMITDPVSVSKLFGYKRNAMPSFMLSEENLTAITKYILSYKSNIEVNITKESNETIPSKSQAQSKNTIKGR